MAWIKTAENLLSIAREETDAIGLALSFGKDSYVCLDLCSRMFRRVEAYYLFRVANMRIVQEWCDFVKWRYGVFVRQYPHFFLSKIYKHHVYAPHWHAMKKPPHIAMRDIENKFRADVKVEWIAMGWRRTDSISRAIIMKQTGGIDFKARRIFPLRNATRDNILDYLAQRKISIPQQFGREEQGGLDFNPGALQFLKEHYPDDYARWVTDFPFSEVSVIADKMQTEKRPKRPLTENGGNRRGLASTQAKDFGDGGEQALPVSANCAGRI